MRALLETLQSLAVDIEEEDTAQAVGRLLERVAHHDDAEDLRAALIHHGALALVHPLGTMLVDNEE